MFRDDVERLSRTVESEVRRLQKEIGDMIGAVGDPRRASYPPLNVWVGDSGAVISAELAGVDPAEVEVSVLGDEVTVSGTRKLESPGNHESYLLRERVDGEFRRTVRLTFRVDADAVNAQFKHGVLRVTLPRESKERARKVTVET